MRSQPGQSCRLLAGMALPNCSRSRSVVVERISQFLNTARGCRAAAVAQGGPRGCRSLHGPGCRAEAGRGYEILLLAACRPACMPACQPACLSVAFLWLLLLLLLRLLLFEITTFFDSLLKFRTVWLAMLAYVNMFRFACLFAWSLLHLPFYFYMCDQSSADGRVTIASTSAGGAASDPETFKHTNSKS